jgi:vanillate O-demethylase ferredoxin subunit
MANDWFELKIAEKHEEAENIFIFELVDRTGRKLPPFAAGSHVEMRIGDNIRHYSLAGSPSDDSRYVIAVQREQSGRGASRTLCDEFQVGQLVPVSSPKNHFKLKETTMPSLLIAGGIGITPIVSMALQLWSEGKPFELHYAARSRQRMAFRSYLQDTPFASRVHFHFSEESETGRLDLAATIGSVPRESHVYVCGPSALIDATTTLAKQLGKPAETVHFERFSGIRTVANGRCDASSFLLQIRSTGKRIPVSAGETAAQALLAAGIALPVSCEQGICGTCVTRILEGVPEHNDGYLTDEERRANMLFVPCCSRAQSDVLVLDL